VPGTTTHASKSHFNNTMRNSLKRRDGTNGGAMATQENWNLWENLANDISHDD
jgi:hypothetical protein